MEGCAMDNIEGLESCAPKYLQCCAMLWNVLLFVFEMNYAVALKTS
jgi:hypothetical protein